MAFGEHPNSVRTLWLFLIFWILSGCAYRQPPLRPESEELPPPAKIKIETPVHPKLETPARPKPGTSARPKPETNLIESEKHALEIPTVPSSTSGFYSHKVRWPAETLSHIAEWYTGTVNNWKAIAKANPELDPRKIGIGDTILIPKDLLTSRKPIPFSFLHPSIHKKAKPPSSSNKTAIPSDSPKLFGPIETELPPLKPDTAKLFGPVETELPPLKPDSPKLFGPVE